MIDGILACEDFAAHLGTSFTLVDPEGATTELVLTDAVAQSSLKRADAPREPFSLQFKAADGIVRPQFSYLLQHAAMGDQHIFLVPVAKDESGVTYEACFS